MPCNRFTISGFLAGGSWGETGPFEGSALPRVELFCLRRSQWTGGTAAASASGAGSCGVHTTQAGSERSSWSCAESKLCRAGPRTLASSTARTRTLASAGPLRSLPQGCSGSTARAGANLSAGCRACRRASTSNFASYYGDRPCSVRRLGWWHRAPTTASWVLKEQSHFKSRPAKCPLHLWRTGCT